MAVAWSHRLLLGMLFCIACLMKLPSTAADLCGCWEGNWKSCTDGFQGTIKARITKCDENHYRAVFTGRAFKIMPYRYTAILTAVTDAETGITHFKSSMKLPIWGCHWMNGCATADKISAKYHTDDHKGYFNMCRTCCPRRPLLQLVR